MNHLTILRASLKSIQAGITPQSYQRVIDVVQANRLAADLVEWVKAAKPACIENLLVLIDELEKELDALKAPALAAPVSEFQMSGTITAATDTPASLVDIPSAENAGQIAGDEPENPLSPTTTENKPSLGGKPEKSTNKRSRNEATDTVEDFQG